MSRIKNLMFLFAMAAQVPLASATVTYVVGNCKPALPTFSTINGALAATPPPNVVQVCPGTYAEEVGIYKPVTLEGITAGTSDQVIIRPPDGGLFIDAGDDFGDFLAAQIFVQTGTGQVNISNLTIDGTGNNVTSTGTYVVGVFFQNSSGTVNHLTVQNQNGNGDGVGIWAEGGSANPSVTVENNNVQASDNAGVYAESASSTSELTAIIKGNNLATTYGTTTGGSAVGVSIGGGLTTTVTGNVISGGFGGMFLGGGTAGSVSGNKVVSTQYGIDLESYGVSVTSNTIYNMLGGSMFGTGIIANSSAPVTGNTIVHSFNGIDFQCNVRNNVHSNTILDAWYGLANVQGTAPPNSYYNVGVINPGGC